MYTQSFRPAVIMNGRNKKSKAMADASLASAMFNFSMLCLTG